MAEATAGALQIVQTQQNLVGKTIVGGASAVTGQSSDEKVQVGILEQIRDITLKSFRATSNIAKTLADSFSFTKDEARRKREQASELEKEGGVKGAGGNTEIDKIQKEGEEKSKRSILFFGGLSKLFDTLLKPFKALFNFIMKIGPVAKIMSALGPAASGLLRLTGIGTVIFILIKYSDEIIKALTPALEAISKLYEKLKPVIDVITELLDKSIKYLISGIGNIIKTLVEDFTTFFGGIGKLFTGDFTGGVKDIFLSILKFIFRIPYVIFLGLKPLLSDAWNFISEGWDTFSQNIRDWFSSIPERFMSALKGIGDKIVYFFGTELPNSIKKWINGLIDSIPLIPQSIKNKFKFDIPEEPKPTETKDESISTSENKLPKTINQDKTVGVTPTVVSAIETMRETGGETIEKTGYTEEQKKGDIETYTKTLNTIDDKIKSLENQYGFPEFEVGNPEYDNAIADEAKDNPALAKAWRSYKGLIRKKYNTVETLKAIEVRPIEEPTITTTKFDRTITKRDLAGQTQTAGVTVVNNQPTTVTSQNSVARSEVMVSKPNASTGDPYFDRQNYAIT